MKVHNTYLYMRTVYYIFAMSIFITAFASCKKDFLNVPNDRTLIRQDYVKDLVSEGEFLNGIYVDVSSNFYSQSTIIYPELVSDNLKPITGLTDLNPLYGWNQLANDEKVVRFNIGDLNANGLWFSGYKIVRNCNFIIESIDQYREQNPQLADNYKGQALALRALIHSVLVITFAQPYNYTTEGAHIGIPYIKSSDYRVPVVRNTVGEIYQNIIQDLQEAVTLLPETFNSKLYLNRTAAIALLARVLLMKEDFQGAASRAREVIGTVPLMSLAAGYPNKLFTSEETEALFQLPPSAQGFKGATYSAIFPGNFFSEAGELILTATGDIASLINEYPNDARNSWITEINSQKTVTKFPSNVIPDFPRPAIGYYQTILRSSEMYLVAAEAFTKLGKSDSAVTYLDAIKLRANPIANPTSASDMALLDSVYKERRKELAFEGFRFYDIQRWKQGVVRQDATLPSALVLPYPSQKAVCPIPLSDVMVAGLQQNQGY